MEWDGSYEKGWTGTLTNKLKTYTSLSVKKLWDDQENQFELQPSSIKEICTGGVIRILQGIIIRQQLYQQKITGLSHGTIWSMWMVTLHMDMM